MLLIWWNHGNNMLWGMLGGSPYPVTGTCCCWKVKILLFLTYRMFHSPNVTRYFIIPWSFLAIHHPELQVKTGNQFKKLSVLTCLHVPPNPRRATSMGYARAGSVTINYTCRGQEVGKGSHPSCWDLSASWVGWPRAGSVLGVGPGVPLWPTSLGKAEITWRMR